MRKNNIDILRAIFALSVLLTHSIQVAKIESIGLLYESFVLSQLAHPGVIGFIVLSGFCIYLSVSPPTRL